MTRDERRVLCDQAVTLDGARARITGASNDYAKVTAVKSGVSFEWSWEAVQRIVAAGGEFQS